MFWHMILRGDGRERLMLVVRVDCLTVVCEQTETMILHTILRGKRRDERRFTMLPATGNLVTEDADSIGAEYMMMDLEREVKLGNERKGGRAGCEHPTYS